ncbi:keratin-associated protein 13-1-like [Choloepus didactylus]|uniref:keratin-associated protein 13-1-like n=1 Tax=Choloepus didactylus TaxID=27675 RepID=UPI00189E75DF|nr:keratin-associated protein 13-1-like [Choloepus didactylus]
MYSDCCPGNFSSCSLGSPLRYPGSSCVSSCPSNLVYSTDLCSPSTCPLGSSLYRGCQETCYKPSSCQTSCVVCSPCQISCYRPRTSSLCSPCQPTYSRPLGYGSRSWYSLGCGVTGFRSLGCGIRGFPFLGYRSGLRCPSYFPSGSCQSSFYTPTRGSGFYPSSF